MTLSRWCLSGVLLAGMTIGCGPELADQKAGQAGGPAPPATKPVLLYSLYFTAKGQEEYTPDGPFSEVLERLKGDFEVRVSGDPLNGRTLRGVKVVLIANPSDKPIKDGPPPNHVSQKDIHTLANFVQGGGGLVFLSNQTEAHNCEKKDSNLLLEHFGIRVTEYTLGVKKILIPRRAPVIGGLRWAFYYGSILDVDEAHYLRPRVLVWNDPDNPPQPGKGAAGMKGPLLATVQVGHGRVVVTGDTGWVAKWGLLEEEPLGTVKGQDNWEIFRRLARWAAGMDK